MMTAITTPIRNRMMIAGIDAIVHLTMKPTMLPNGISISTTVTRDAGSSLLNMCGLRVGEWMGSSLTVYFRSCHSGRPPLSGLGGIDAASG